MSFSFALPGMLWALAALALPLLLHLVRRERQKRTVFAALAWLDPKQRPRRRLRFRDWGLLALRLLIVAALALWLAGLRRDDPPAPARVTLVHPALPAPAAAQDDSFRWWAPGFPPVAEPAPPPPADPASLLRGFDAGLPASTTLAVQVPAWLDGLDAAPIRLSREVQWSVSDRSPATDPPAGLRTPALSIRANPEDPALPWLRAVQAAWRVGTDAPGAPDLAAPGAAPPSHADVLAWTSPVMPDAATLAWVADGGTLLLDHAAPWPLPRTPVAMDAEGWLQGAGHGDGRVVQWRVPLDAGNLPALLDPGFPQALRRKLVPPPPPARADAGTVAPRTGAAAPHPAPRPLDTALAIIVLALFALERLLSLGRTGRAAA